MNSFKDRIIRAAKLDVNLYEEVEADKSAMSQAMMVVVLAALAGGVATIGRSGVAGLLIGTFGALISWYICKKHRCIWIIKPQFCHGKNGRDH